MSEPTPLPPREYAVWLRASELPAGPTGGALGDVMTDLALKEALHHAWLDEKAQLTLHLRIGRRDLAAIQADIDASMRALLRRSLEDVGPAARATLETALEFQGYFPMSPLGRALATQLEVIVSDTARGKQPAAWAGEKGLVARAIYRVNGTLSISPPRSRAGAPPLDVLTALLRALRDDAKLWKRWCNLLVMHVFWANGLVACLRQASMRLAEPEREMVARWLAEPDWFSTRGAILGSTSLETYTVTKVELVIEQR